MVKDTLTVEISADELEAMYHIVKTIRYQWHLHNTRLMRSNDRLKGFVEYCEKLLEEQVDWEDEEWLEDFDNDG